MPRMRAVDPPLSVFELARLKLAATLPRSLRFLTPDRSSESPLNAVTAIGTSCSRSLRSVAVTIISLSSAGCVSAAAASVSASCAMAGAVASIASIEQDTAHIFEILMTPSSSFLIERPSKSAIPTKSRIAGL